MSCSTGDSRVLRMRFPAAVNDATPAAHGFAPMFTVDLMEKDLALAEQLAADHGVEASPSPRPSRSTGARRARVTVAGLLGGRTHHRRSRAVSAAIEQLIEEEGWARRPARTVRVDVPGAYFPVRTSHSRGCRSLRDDTTDLTSSPCRACSPSEAGRRPGGRGGGDSGRSRVSRDARALRRMRARSSRGVPRRVLVALLLDRRLRRPRRFTDAEQERCRSTAARSQGCSMASHELKPPVRLALVDAPETGHDAGIPTCGALSVESGDKVVVDCRDSLDGRSRRHARRRPRDARWDRASAVRADRGPWRRAGRCAASRAARGRDRRLRLDSGVPGLRPARRSLRRALSRDLGLHDGSATSGRLEGIRIPADPFVGVIGVAPSHERMEQFRLREAALAESGGDALPPTARGAVPAVEPYASTALRTIPPRETGGNLDVPQARAGATSSCRSTSLAHCSRSATSTSRRAKARSAERRSRRTRASRCASKCCRRPGSAIARAPPPSSRSNRSGRAGGGTS